MPFAACTDIAKTVFYITRINRNYKQDGVSTMTLDLVAGRTMGQPSVFDIMWTLYRTFYTERKDTDINLASNLQSQYDSSNSTNNSSSSTDLSTMDTDIGEIIDTSFTEINSSNPPATSAWNQQRMAAIYNYFHNTVRFNKAACCGIIANLAQETGGQFNYEANNADANNNAQNLGIVQWQGGRATNLKRFAEEKGKSWNDLSVQLEFIEYELKNNYSKVYDVLINVPNTAPGAYEAGLSFAQDYEVCSANYNGHNFQTERAAIAKKLFTNCFKNID